MSRGHPGSLGPPEQASEFGRSVGYPRPPGERLGLRPVGHSPKVRLSADAIAGILVTLIVGGWAAIFATRADLAMRRSMRDEKLRHDQDVRPRLEPVAVSPDPYPPNTFTMEIANRGGATPLFAFAIQSEHNIFITSGSLDEHARERFIFQYVGKLDYKTGMMLQTPFVVAQDRMGRWWDCTLNHMLAGRLIESSPRGWLDARLKERGLTEMLEGQLTWRLQDYRIDPARLQAIMDSGRSRGGLLSWLRQRMRRTSA